MEIVFPSIWHRYKNMVPQR